VPVDVNRYGPAADPLPALGKGRRTDRTLAPERPSTRVEVELGRMT
jgi:hypothetical protein